MAFFNKGRNDNEVKKSKQVSREERIKDLLIEGEIIENIYYSIGNYIFITNKRIFLLVNDINLNDPKMTNLSIPIKNIDSVGITKRGGAIEFSIYSKGQKHYIELAEKDVDISEIHRIVSSKIL